MCVLFAFQVDYVLLVGISISVFTAIAIAFDHHPWTDVTLDHHGDIRTAMTKPAMTIYVMTMGVKMTTPPSAQLVKHYSSTGMLKP
jgi:hypothetical protein